MATLSPQEQAWMAKVTPTAEEASQATGVNQAVILAQWGNETGWGTSAVFNNTHNFAGVTTPKTGGYVHYANDAAGVQGWIQTMMQSTYAAVRSAPTAEAQARALAASPWAAGHYTGGVGLDLHAVTASLSSVSGVVAGQSSSGTSTSAAAGTPSPATTSATASASIDAVLKTAGLGTLIPWANSLATQLTAQGLSASAISTTVKTQLETQPAFKSKFPGIAERVANGYPAMSITEYLSYTAEAKQMGKAAGLPTGFMTTTEIGKLVSNDVSITELSTRLTKGYEVAQNAPAETKALLTSYFGIKTGTLAAYFLTPTKATKVLQNQITAAQIGTAGVQSGFNLPAPKPGTQTQGTNAKGQPTVTALYLAQTGVSQATAADTFQSLAKLSPLMESLPGTGGEKTSLGENDLVNYGFYGTNTLELQNVEQARSAPFHGGGGYVEGAKGILGAGFGNSQGQTGT